MSEKDETTPSQAQEQSKPVPQQQPNNPLHGIKLADILEYLVEKYGWEELGHRINIRCFNSDPSIKSSLKFLRKTQWARDKVERLYLRSIR
ncbi:MAG: VF530 family protein [Mariniblastus sp.]|nr:VF530 family protein [Mariniblastus sp.]